MRFVPFILALRVKGKDREAILNPQPLTHNQTTTDYQPRSVTSFRRVGPTATSSTTRRATKEPEISPRSVTNSASGRKGLHGNYPHHRALRKWQGLRVES